VPVSVSVTRIEHCSAGAILSVVAAGVCAVIDTLSDAPWTACGIALPAHLEGSVPNVSDQSAKAQEAFAALAGLINTHVREPSHP
jgi:hypothetical protein